MPIFEKKLGGTYNQGDNITFGAILMSVMNGQVSHWKSELPLIFKGQCLWLLTNYGVISVKSKLSCLRMCHLFLLHLFPWYLICVGPCVWCWPYRREQKWTQSWPSGSCLHGRDVNKNAVTAVMCFSEESYCVCIYGGFWTVCGLRRSFCEERWPEFWSNGELTGQKKGAFCAKGIAHSAAGRNTVLHGAA